MKSNVGGIDRILRIVVGLVLIALAATNTVGWWGWLGIVPLATGLLGWCPPYALLGFNLEERFFLEMCKAGVLVNVVMFVFNLFPLPPLDGGRILVGLLPLRPAALLARIEPWGFFIVMALVISGIVSNLWMRPLMGLTYDLLDLLLSPLSLLLR